MSKKSFIDKQGLQKFHELLKEELPRETDGAIDTMFDTEFDEATGQLKFGEGCASMDEETGVLTIEGAVVPVIENGVEIGKMIVIS